METITIPREELQIFQKKILNAICRIEAKIDKFNDFCVLPEEELNEIEKIENEMKSGKEISWEDMKKKMKI